MPYTKKELKKNEYWQRLHEQDRVDYQRKLEDAESFSDVVQVVDENLGILPIAPVVPLRNEAGTFLAFENPDTGLNYDRPDQRLPVAKNSPHYHRPRSGDREGDHSGDLYYQTLDTEIKDLV
jgi:hypothetical protein